MTDFLSYVGSWSVLKWIVLVLIAGFIGQFGKMAAEAIARKIRARNGTSDEAPKETPASSPSPSSSAGEVNNKKLIKAMAKAKKKEAKR